MCNTSNTKRRKARQFYQSQDGVSALSESSRGGEFYNPYAS
nr:MAG TPA: hypothetical protein [Caudoviricetes sp.]